MINSGSGGFAQREDTLHLDYKFCQVFGDDCQVEMIPETDIISAVAFNKDGTYLAAGDKGGRVIVFERTNADQPPKRSRSGSLHPSVEYRFYAEYQSHENAFDYLRSIEIDERIDAIKWLPTRANGLFLLSTNEKDVKLWKLYTKHRVEVYDQNNTSQVANQASALGQQGVRALSSLDSADGSMQGANGVNLKIPKLKQFEEQVIAKPCKTYKASKHYRVNSLAPSAAGDTFLVADDLSINHWWLEDDQQAYNVVDLKSPNPEEITEVITTANANPWDSSVFAYGTSRGVLRLCDMRRRAVFDRAPTTAGFATGLPGVAQNPAAVYMGDAMGGNGSSRSFMKPTNASIMNQLSNHNLTAVSDLVTGISSIKFVGGGTNLVLARDMMDITVWDIRDDSKPLFVIPVHPQIRNNVADIIEENGTFEKFDIAVSRNSKFFATGSYGDRFHIYNLAGSGIGAEATRQITKRRKNKIKFPGYAINAKPILYKGKPLFDNLPVDVDTHKKALFMDYHPTDDILAVATAANLYIYGAVYDPDAQLATMEQMVNSQ